MTPVYTTTAVSSGDGRNGRAMLDDGTLDLTMASPKEMGGSGAGANPEQLFALGYSACFHSALKFVARQAGKSTEGSTVTAEVGIGPDDGGYRLSAALRVQLPALSLDEAQALVDSAHQMCPYSAATRGNIPVELTVEAG